MTKPPINAHENYHAHVYYDESTSDIARKLCADIGERFGLQVGRFHEKLVGPHPKWSCQVLFDSSDFDEFVYWLDEHRNGLTVLVHGLSGDDLLDHTEHAYWLGDAVELNLGMFKSG